MSALAELDLVGIADAIRNGEFSSEEVTSFCLDRLEHEGRFCNAVVRIDAQAALEAARDADVARARGDKPGPLGGVPMAHKDLFHRAGYRSAGGSRIRADHVADETASVLARLDGVGAIDLGALHMAEFALSPTGFNQHYGHALNPWNHAHVPGGSSSGSAIAVAGRMVFGSLGTDTGGSIRNPAAMCGITGLKPTLRRVSVSGVMPLARSLDCVGPLAQSARDCARLLGVIAGFDPRDESSATVPTPDYEARLDDPIKGWRIAVPRGYYDDSLDPEVRAAHEQSLRVFRDLGATAVETRVPDMALLNTMTHVVMSCEAAAFHRRWLAERPQEYSDQVRARIEPGLHYLATRYIEALELRAQLTEEYLRVVLADCDLVHLPAIATKVPTIQATTQGSPEDVAAVISALTHFTRAINYLGLPALSLPAGFSGDGLPIGFQLVARHFDEQALLNAGHAFQRVTDWHRRIPAVHTISSVP